MLMIELVDNPMVSIHRDRIITVEVATTGLGKLKGAPGVVLMTQIGPVVYKTCDKVDEAKKVKAELCEKLNG